MTQNVTDVTIIKRLMYTYLAQMAWDGSLVEQIDDLPERILSERPMNYRCCEHKEIAILKERIRVALGLSRAEVSRQATLSQMATQSLQELPKPKSCAIEMMSVACDRCPLDKFIVTDACRNCGAHHCQVVCPRNAITIVHNRAYIDRSKCSECGLCARNCRFRAIVQITRPCEQACAVNAITKDKDTTAAIDCDRCVSCAACLLACPFGSVSDYTQIVTAVTALKNKEKPVHAILAPSFVGQFGPKASPGALIAALSMLGFDKVHEAAAGAEQVALEEAAEFAERMATGHNYMTSSCCPSFVGLVEKHYPDLASEVSHTRSPMVVLADKLKKEHEGVTTIFIGPCISKKAEASNNPSVDIVLTFEELGCLFVSRGINVASITAIGELRDAGPVGRGFGKHGGVAAAIRKALDGKMDLEIRAANGLRDAQQVLEDAKNGKLRNTFVEGMSCCGGCVGGPGTLINQNVAAKLLERFCQEPTAKARQQA